MGVIGLLATLTVLQTSATVFTGTVHSTDGRPVAGAAVALYRIEAGEARAERLMLGQARPAVASTRTAADGSFRLEAGLGIAHIEVRASGFAPGAVAAAAGDPVQLELPPAKPRRGTVTGQGRPVAGAILTWTGPRDTAGAFPEWVVKTDRGGAYEVPDPDAWAGEAVILHRDFAVAQAEREGQRWPSPLRHELQSGQAVEGKVAAGAGGRAVGVATLWLDGWPVGKTAADGTFAIRHAAPRWRSLVAKTASLVGMAKPGTGRISISMQPGPSVAGTVRDSRTHVSVPGATVTLAGPESGGVTSAVTDERGRYAFAGLAPGRYWPVSVLRAGYASLGREYDEDDVIDLRRSAAATRDFGLTRLGRLRGRVQDERGRAVTNALVMLVPKGVPTVYSLATFAGGDLARTGADGSFALPYDPAELEDESDHTMDRALLAFHDGYAATRLEAVEVGAGTRPLVVTLARGAALNGRVLGEDGTPLPDVGVLIAEDSAVSGAVMPAHTLLAHLPAEGWVKSGPDGRFTVRVRPGLHDLSFRKPGYTPKLVAAHDPAGALEVSLARSAALRGILVSHDGRGVPGVGIYVAQPSGVQVSTRTSDDGTFTIEELSAGPYELWAAKENTGIRAIRRGEVPAPDLRIELGPLGALRGRVVDGKTGAPVTRFTVAADRSASEPEAEGWEGSQAQEMSDPDGAFLLEDLPAGDVSLLVQAEGYLRQEASGVVSPGGEQAPPLEIALEEGVAIQGRVTSTAGEPLPDAQVSASGGDPDFEASTESDEKGHYRLAGLYPGTVTVQFQRPGYVTQRKSFDTAETTRADAALARGLSVKGVVTSGGVGVARVHVAATSSAVDAQDASAVSGEGGAFTLDGLTPGRYTVRAASQDGDEATLENVDVETTGPLRLVLEREPTAVVFGTVTGLPPADADLTVRVVVSAEEGRSAHAPVDARGAFRVEKAPAGRVRVQAFASSVFGSARSSRASELTLAPGSESQTVLEFSSDIVVSGRITRDGAPLPRAGVFFHAQDATGSTASARAAESGDYELVGLEPGPYTVTVSDTGLSFSTDYFVRESARFDIDATGGSVRGSTVDAANGSPLGGVDVSFWREGESRPTTSQQANVKGEFAVRSLREGRYRVVTSKKGYGQEVREVDLQPGATAELVLELSASDGLGLAVVDARDNRPLDATVVVRDLAKRVVANQHSGVGADGTLNIPLAPGRYLLSTSASGYGTATVPVTAPARGVRVGLTPGGTLVLVSERDLRGRVRLLTPDGEEYVRCWCNGIADIQLTGRHTRVANVTAGTYTVELVDHAGVATRGPTVVIEEGQTATVEIE